MRNVWIALTLAAMAIALNVAYVLTEPSAADTPSPVAGTASVAERGAPVAPDPRIASSVARLNQIVMPKTVAGLARMDALAADPGWRENLEAWRRDPVVAETMAQDLALHESRGIPMELGFMTALSLVVDKLPQASSDVILSAVGCLYVSGMNFDANGTCLAPTATVAPAPPPGFVIVTPDGAGTLDVDGDRFLISHPPSARTRQIEDAPQTQRRYEMPVGNTDTGGQVYGNWQQESREDTPRADGYQYAEYGTELVPDATPSRITYPDGQTNITAVQVAPDRIWDYRTGEYHRAGQEADGSLRQQED